MTEWDIDDEIQCIVTAGYVKYVHLGQPECRKAIDRAIARAAQKKLVEWLLKWGDGQCEHADTGMSPRHGCDLCWRDFKEIMK
jgi:hypothetical protein